MKRGHAGHLAAWLLLSLLLAGCARARATTSPTLDGRQRLAQYIGQVMNLPGVQRGVWGIVVHSLDRNERLFELNPRTLLVPASVAKLVAVATAVDAVGWEYRYETQLVATGPIVDGVLEGDLLIVGSGDPSIGGRAGEDVTGWIDALAARGIRRIEGRIIGDDDAVEEPRPALAWAWDDLGYRTGALFGALNYSENRMPVIVTPATMPGHAAALTVAPTAAGRPLTNRTTTGAPGSPQLLWPEQRPGETALTIAGSTPLNATATTLLVSAGNPTQWFASVFRHRLIAAGIAVSGEAIDGDDAVPPPDRATTSVLHTHRSRPLAEIAQPLLKESINLYAEAVMRLNVPRGTFPTNDAALEAVRARLNAWGIPADHQQLVDGSGLSRRDVITPEALLAVLQRMYDRNELYPWVTALPAAGVDGSLADRMKDTSADGNVRAKTGTMSNVRSLAGYVSARDGERLAFVIIVNNFEGPGPAATQAVDSIAVRLARFTRQ